MKLTIEIKAEGGEYQSVIYADANIPLWRSHLTPTQGEALARAARLIAAMPTDFVYAAELNAPIITPKGEEAKRGYVSVFTPVC